MPNITNTTAWEKLKQHKEELANKSIIQLFIDNPERFKKMSFQLGGLLADFSKNKTTDKTLHLLINLAHECGLPNAINDMFSGKKINTTENRAVLHTALRAHKSTYIELDDKNIVPDIHKVLKRMGKCAESIRKGKWRGHTGKEITDIVNIGIGGSLLGAQLATEALSGYAHGRIKIHYVSNVEASELHHILHELSPETTLFIIASKTFTTTETMTNARNAREKIIRHFNDENAITKHFIALSTNIEAVAEFGIAPENMFPFWDWVGGRYSMWSAIGLSSMISIGHKNFIDFLTGAEDMDKHFVTSPLEQNIPVLMGMIGIWHRNFMNYPTYAVIPYHSGLRRLPAWLQQVDMESNGKHINKDGEEITYPTGAAVFGEPGTDAQHSFFQWLHQGTDIVPVDFIAAINTSYGNKDQQHMLLANCLAQSEALMNGQTIEGEPHRHFAGNRPSTTILLDKLSPRLLGSLLALYEHKVFVQGVIWGINSFDQFGVELGKVLAKTIHQEMTDNKIGAHDASTAGLMEYIKENSK